MVYKWKNSEKSLTSNLVWSKKVGVQTPPPKNLESTPLGKQENFKHYFGLKIAMIKKIGPQPPLKNSFQSAW